MIGDCLESLQGVADEIVVVDSNSDDATREIASQYTERVIEHPFDGHIEQKNFAVSHAAHEWILSLDCDERLSHELRTEILERKKSLDKFAAYRMPRKTFYVYRWLHHCWYPDRKIRLFNREHAYWGGVNPHDHVLVNTGSVEDLRGDILHFSFNSVSAHLQTLDRFTDIGARQAYARGKRASAADPILHGAGTFTKQYLLKRGFLDGFAGLTASFLSGVHAYVKYAKLRVMALEAANSGDTPPE
jgi:glycosyltransferase involved in cell wall biosynthesis